MRSLYASMILAAINLFHFSSLFFIQLVHSINSVCEIE